MAKKLLTRECPKCGLESSANSFFCPRCGQTLRSLSASCSGWKPESVSELFRVVQDRTRTDRIISPAYAVALIVGPFAVLLLRIAVGVPAGQFGGAIGYSSLIVTSVFSVLFAKVVYDAIQRQNNHFLRERRLREAICSLVKSSECELSQSADAKKEVSGLIDLVTPPADTEKIRSPLWWASVEIASFALPWVWLLSVAVLETLGVQDTLLNPLAFLAVIVTGLAFGILELYMMMFLMMGTWGHDARWIGFVEKARAAIARLGYPSGTLRMESPLPKRSFSKYLVLSALTGVFLLYWWYTLVKDPNDHFERQWKVEDQLLGLVGIGTPK